MKLYVFPPSPNARKVLATAYHLGLPFESEIIDLTKGDQRKPEYLQINPNGRMPTMVDGDFVLWESNAIMQYLASRKPSALWPEDARQRMDISRWQFWEAAHWGPTVGTFLFENLVKQIVGMGAPDAAKLKEGQMQMGRFAPVLDAHLATRDWLVGDALTLADISLGASLAYSGACKLPLEPYPHIRSWHQRLEQVDAMKKTAPQPPN